MNFLILTQYVFTADVNYPRPEPFMLCNVLFIHKCYGIHVMQCTIYKLSAMVFILTGILMD